MGSRFALSSLLAAGILLAACEGTVSSPSSSRSSGGGSGPRYPGLCGGKTCAPEEDCCLVTATCFDPAGGPTCPAPAPGTVVPDGKVACSANSDCGPDEMCFALGLLCEGPGYCQSKANCGTCTGGSVCELCGCNGVTYPDVQTACGAGVRPVWAAHGACGASDGSGSSTGSGGGTPGFIPCGSAPVCPDGSACCFITGVCYDPAVPPLCTQPPEGTSFPCVDNSQCAVGYCQGTGCGTPGGCASPTGDCTGQVAEVCGCDGSTYLNAGCAAIAGTRVASQGACTN